MKRPWCCFDSFHFVHRHLATLGPALILMFGVSLLSPVGVRRLALLLFVFGLLLMVLVSVFGADINGARRWISLAGLSMQPSELVKPSFAVVTAWLLACPKKTGMARWRRLVDCPLNNCFGAVGGSA